MDIRRLYWDLVIHFDESLTVYQREMLHNKLRPGIPHAIHRDKNVNKGDTMKFKIDKTKKQVQVSMNASTEIVQQAGISARNHGYELVMVAPAPKCSCHDCVQFGFTSHPIQVR